MVTTLYRHFDKDDRLLYIGISLNVLQRTLDHARYSHWFNDSVRMEMVRFETRDEALHAERVAIISEKPLYNIAWAGDFCEPSIFVPKYEPKPKPPIKSLMKEHEVAEFLDMSFTELQRLRAKGLGPPFICLSGCRIIYKRKEVEEWAQSIPLAPRDFIAPC